MTVFVCVCVQLVAHLIYPAVNPDEVTKFLWQHMHCDVDIVHTAIGCSLDDVLVLLHLLFKHALENRAQGSTFSVFRPLSGILESSIRLMQVI